MDGGNSQHLYVNSCLINLNWHLCFSKYITFLACGCNLSGAKDDICEKSSGKCECKDNVLGDKCIECASEYWNFPACTGG